MGVAEGDASERGRDAHDRCPPRKRVGEWRGMATGVERGADHSSVRPSRGFVLVGMSQGLGAAGLSRRKAGH